MITGLYPESIFCAIETSGDGKVNVQSRVQMFLFKARLAAQREYAEALARMGKTAAEVRAFFDAHPDLASGLHRAPHAAAGTAADRLAEIAPLMEMTPAQIRIHRLLGLAAGSLKALRAAPTQLVALSTRWKEKSPAFLAQVREEWAGARPVVAEKLRARARAGVDGMRAAVRRPARPSAAPEARA
jgi:hypothetical protein